MTELIVSDCWNDIGVWGNKTCSDLSVLTHCNVCHKYSLGGQSLLNREPPRGYIQEWTELLATPKEAEAPFDGSLTVFRIGAEWFSLPT